MSLDDIERNHCYHTDLFELGARPIKSRAFRNPQDFFGGGRTPGFIPPEQTPNYANPEDKLVVNAKIEEKVMVFGFAASTFRASPGMFVSKHL
jgi:hypothetical protein